MLKLPKIDFQHSVSSASSKTEHLMQKKFAHFKFAVFNLVAERQEAHIPDSLTAAILRVSPRCHRIPALSLRMSFGLKLWS